MKCKLCESENVLNFLNRKNVPVMQNLIVKDETAARNVARGELQICYCDDCGFVFNNAFDKSLIAYEDEYDNNQTHSTYFNGYIDEIISGLTRRKGLKNSLIVEVGCGKGDFIKKLIGTPGFGNKGIGFDTTYEGAPSFFEGALKFEKKYFAGENEGFKPDAIICRHVIEHIPEPAEFIRSIKQAAGGGESLRYFFETPCVEWILNNKVVFDFFYEHCSYFNNYSIKKVFSMAGILKQEVIKVFNGQYLWVEASSSSPDYESGNFQFEEKMQTLINEYCEADKNFNKKCGDLLGKLAAGQNKTAVWGAGAKGVTFLNLVDPDKNFIDYAVDLNSNKCGNYIPGSAQLIIDFKKIPYYNIKNIILMNPNYIAEVQKLLDGENINVKIIDITEYQKK